MKLKSLIVAAATLVLSTTTLMAQNRGGEKMDCEEMTKRRVETLTKEIKINAEQQKEVTKIYTKSCKDSQAAMQSQDREKIRQIREESNKAIEAILTPEQAKLWKEYLAKQPQRGQGRGGNQRGNGNNK